MSGRMSTGGGRGEIVKDRLVRVEFAASGNCYDLVAVVPIKKGDRVIVTQDGKVRRAYRKDNPIGVVVDDRIPEGCLSVEREKES